MGEERRTTSTEMTAVIPRDQLPPPRIHHIIALDLDPEHPETRELLERARDDLRNRPTMVPCPAGCATCDCCGGAGMVTVERAAEWRQRQVEAREEPTDEPIELDDEDITLE